MRIAYFNIKKEDVKNIKIDTNFNKSVFADNFNNDYDSFAYCMDTRIYNLVFIKYEDIIYKKYFNVFKYLLNNNIDTKVYFYVDKNEQNHNCNYFKENIKMCYSKLNVEIIYVDKENDFSKFISEKVNNYFLDFLNLSFIEKFYIDETDGNNRTLKMVVSGNILEIKLDSVIDFNVLMFFVKNYGNIVSFRSIASAISDTPEKTSNLKIEKSIAHIRQSIEKFNNLVNIQTFTKNGYKFIINNF